MSSPLPVVARPALPDPQHFRRQQRRDGGYELVPAYTPEELAAYAAACEAALLAKLREQRPVAWLDVSKRGFVRTAWISEPTADQLAVAEHDGDTIIPLVPWAAAPAPVVGWLVSGAEGDDEFVDNPSALKGRHHKGRAPLALVAAAQGAALHCANPEARGGPHAAASPEPYLRAALRLAREALLQLGLGCAAVAESDWRGWQELASAEEFERWAKSRAAHIASNARAAVAQIDALGGRP